MSTPKIDWKNVPAEGRFVWYDLMTQDRDGAISFYKQLLGWTTEEMDMGEMGTYPMFKAGDRHVGGSVQIEKEHGDLPSHWISYVTCEDVDAACGRAEEAGGQVCVPPTDIPRVGRFAVVTDPQGAVFSPFTFAGDVPPEDDPNRPRPNEFCWTELMTGDPRAALDFYHEVFGWKHSEMEMSDGGTYHIFNRGEKGEAGMMLTPAGSDAPPSWMPYIYVEDVDGTAGKAESLGGKVWMPPRSIPGAGRFAVIGDPTGAVFGVWKSEPRES